MCSCCVVLFVLFRVGVRFLLFVVVVPWNVCVCVLGICVVLRVVLVLLTVFVLFVLVFAVCYCLCVLLFCVVLCVYFGV